MELEYSRDIELAEAHISIVDNLRIEKDVDEHCE